MNRETRVYIEKEDSPESPPPFDRSSFRSDTSTKIRVETGDTDVRFSIDCVGRFNYANSERSDGSEVEVVGAFASLPYASSSAQSKLMFPNYEADKDSRIDCSPSTSRDVDYRSNLGYSSQDRDYRKETLPLYNIEPDMVIAGGISAQRSESGIGIYSRNDSRSESAPPRPKNTCWNCKGDHMITDCPTPRDGRRIAENRKIFMAAKGTRNNNSFPGGRQKRYHEEQTSRIGEPGVLSPELRYAMELEGQQVPIHVYRMRLYGYPPGWLDNAMEEASSGLKLYGDSITMSVGTRKEPRINPDSIINYPGFNTSMPYGETDRGREYNCPRYRLDDSIENMLRKLDSQNLVIDDDDGIVSQQASQQGWDSTAALDRPALNDGAIRGIGRGRYVETTLPLHLQPGRGPTNQSRQPVFRQRIDRECRPMREKPAIIPQDVDERYLPIHTPNPHKRARESSRSVSPSLLRGDGDAFDNLQSPQSFTMPDSPVILNLPPVPSSSKSFRGAIAPNCGTSGGSATGSSNDFPSSPVPKRRKKIQDGSCAASDDEVMIINDADDKKDSEEYDSDCLVIDTDGEPSTVKRTSPVRPTRTKATTTKKPAASSTPKAPPPEVFQVDSLDSEDWETDKPQQQQQQVYYPAASPGSTTGDEETFETATNNDPKRATPQKPSPQSIRVNFDEDWEDKNNESDNDDKLVIDEEPQKENDGTTNEAEDSIAQSPKAEFIPANSKIEAIKDVLLANIEEDPDENERSFTSLPTLNKFALGMPEMVFQEQFPERTGRLDKVLQVLKTRKSGGNL